MTKDQRQDGPRPGPAIVFADETEVIEYSAYEAVCKERDELGNKTAEMNVALAKQEIEIYRLSRVIAKELSENDELGAEYTYVNSLRADLAIAKEALEKISKNKTDDCEIYTMGCDCDDEAKNALTKLGGAM